MERTIRRVLCPVQLTDFSGGLVRVGSAFASRCDADLFAVHVLNHARPDAARRVGGRPSAQEAAIRIRGLIRANSDVDPRDVTSAVRHGDPVKEILAYADRMAADLIVVGRSVRPRWPRFGAVTTGGEDAVARDLAPRARCAVLSIETVDENGSVAPALPKAFRHIVCGVDFSRPSLYAVSHAIRLAVKAAGFLTLVHVVPHQTDSWPNKLPRLIHRLRNLVGRDVRSACGVREIVAVGRPVDELLKVVRRESADLLVLGIADRAGTNESAGTLAAIAREQAEIPVLLVPCPGGDFPERDDPPTCAGSSASVASGIGFESEDVQ
jgi:nucleotide-binding universal stress UspA family protein